MVWVIHLYIIISISPENAAAILYTYRNIYERLNRDVKIYSDCLTFSYRRGVALQVYLGINFALKASKVYTQN